MDPPQVGDKVLAIKIASNNDTTSAQIYDSYVDPIGSMNSPVISMVEREDQNLKDIQQIPEESILLQLFMKSQTRILHIYIHFLYQNQIQLLLNKCQPVHVHRCPNVIMTVDVTA